MKWADKRTGELEVCVAHIRTVVSQLSVQISQRAFPALLINTRINIIAKGLHLHPLQKTSVLFGS